MNNTQYATQNNLLLNTLLKYYGQDDNLSKILSIINGHSRESLRLIDWFVTNYAKAKFIGYDLKEKNGRIKRFKVYIKGFRFIILKFNFHKYFGIFLFLNL